MITPPQPTGPEGTVQVLSRLAVRVSKRDNVAVAKESLTAGSHVVLEDGRELEVLGDVTPGNRFALEEIPAGQFVLQYSSPIGTSRGIPAGGPVTRDNMSNDVPSVREIPDDLSNPAPDYVAVDERAMFRGFRRPDGRVGTRNWIVVVATSMCSSHEAQQIAMRADLMLFDRERYPNVDGVVALAHNKGCGCSDGSNLEITLRTLANFADHPNVGAAIFIDLGCEKTNLSKVDQHLKDRGGMSWNKPIEWMGIQESGGTLPAIEAGLKKVEELLPAVNEAEREECGMDSLILGVECGGSDGLSGLSANPSLGRCSDLVVRHGGTVIISEVPEFCGAEHLFAMRARDATVARQVLAAVDWYKEYAARLGSELGDNPSPGNVAGGLLNISIKSLGAMAKGGTTRVEGVTDYASPPTGRGLWLMQGPGYDQESVPGMVAAGANAVVFTTGRGTTIGNAIVPVIKLASNTPIFERMKCDIDLSAGGVIDGTESLEEVGERIFEHVRAVAGRENLSHAETNGHREFQIWPEQAVSL